MTLHMENVKPETYLVLLKGSVPERYQERFFGLEYYPRPTVKGPDSKPIFGFYPITEEESPGIGDYPGQIIIHDQTYEGVVLGRMPYKPERVWDEELPYHFLCGVPIIRPLKRPYREENYLEILLALSPLGRKIIEGICGELNRYVTSVTLILGMGLREVTYNLVRSELSFYLELYGFRAKEPSPGKPIELQDTRSYLKPENREPTIIATNEALYADMARACRRIAQIMRSGKF